MKAWAVLLPLLCMDCRRIDKRSPQEAEAPPDGYLPSKEYEYDDDLAGYNNLLGYSSAENELPSESEDSSQLIDSDDNTTIKDDMGTNTTDLKNKNPEDEEEEDLIRYNAGADDLLGNEAEPRIEFDQPVFSSDSTKDDETTTQQPDDEMQDIVEDDMEGSGAVRSKLETGYGSPIDEKIPNVEKDNFTDGYNSPEEEDSVVTENVDIEYGAPPLETEDLNNVTKDAGDTQTEDKDMLEETINNNDDIEGEKNQNETSVETTENPNMETADNAEQDGNEPNISDDNLNSSSLSAAIKICPGGSMTVCVSVCPGTSATIYGACVQGCADRCEGQDPR